MITALASSLQVRLGSLTNTQGLPQNRLTYIAFAELKHACPYRQCITAETSHGHIEQEIF